MDLQDRSTLGAPRAAGQGGQWGASTYRNLGGAPSQLVSRPPNWQLPGCPPRHQGGVGASPGGGVINKENTMESGEGRPGGQEREGGGHPVTNFVSTVTG